MAFHNRNISSKINNLLEKFPAVLVLGVRQCGKSTLAKMLRPDWKYFDLENSKDYDFISGDYDFFFNQYPTNLIFDEAQELPELFKNLRGIIDKDSAQNNRFILTGSSSPELVQYASDSLAGRIGIVELGPFKFNEIEEIPLSDFYHIFEKEISARTIETLLSLSEPKVSIDTIDHMLKGGYPAPVLDKDPDYFDDWMEYYFQTYINRDIRRLFPKLDSVKYRRFISMLSGLSGTIINKAQLGRSLDISEMTARDYLDTGNKTFIWRIIPSYEKTNVKSITKMPKGVLRDTGLLHYLSSIDNREKLLRSPNFGHNFETFVIEEIIRGIQSSAVNRWDYYYYRTKSGIEVDLVLQGTFGTLPIEIKSGSSTSYKNVKSLQYFIESQNLPLGIVINNDSEIKMIHNKIVQIPAYYL